VAGQLSDVGFRVLLAVEGDKARDDDE